MRSVCLSVAAIVAIATMAFGCVAADSGESESDEDQGSAEQNLSTCALGAGCATLNVLGKRAFDAPIANRTRTDVRANAAGNEVVPRILVQKTSRLVKFDGGRATLSGDAGGTKPFFFDDFILVEVLAVDGKTLASTVIGHEQQTVRVEGKTIAPLSPVAPWAGPNQGFAYQAGAIDLASLLPRDQAFKLRFTAFDTGGVGLVSDVHLRWSASTPGGNVDPFDPASCVEPPMSWAEAVSRFAPAATWANVTREPKVAIRSRACNPVTGCAEWRAETTIPFSRWVSSYGGGGYHWYELTTPLAPSAIDLQVVNENEIRTWVYLNEGTGGKTLRFSDRFGSGFREGNWDTTELVQDRTTQIDRVAVTGNVGKTCSRLIVTSNRDGREYEMVVFARY